MHRGWGLLFLFVLLASTAPASSPPETNFTEGLNDRLLHVHPEINYALHPDWLALWEQDRIGGNTFRGTFGSTHTKKLLVDSRWALNSQLAGGTWFRNDITWQERRHLPNDVLSIMLGLEQRVWHGLAAVVQCMPTEAKENLDVQLGALWASPDRTQYLQLLYVMEDVVYDEKNDRGGESVQAPRGLNWLLRVERGAWSLYSSGQWLSGYERDYPDPGLEPEIFAESKTNNELEAYLRWRPDDRTHVELSWRQADNAEAQVNHWDPYSYDYTSWYRTLAVRALYPLADRWRLRGEFRQLKRRDTTSGYGAFAFHRDEVMPALYGEWSWGSANSVELGYMGTFYEWEFESQGDAESGYADKIELGLVLGLARQSALKFALSHELSLEKFGGGNVRMITRF